MAVSFLRGGTVPGSPLYPQSQHLPSKFSQAVYLLFASHSFLPFTRGAQLTPDPGSLPSLHRPRLAQEVDPVSPEYLAAWAGSAQHLPAALSSAPAPFGQTDRQTDRQVQFLSLGPVGEGIISFHKTHCLWGFWPVSFPFFRFGFNPFHKYVWGCIWCPY